MNDVLPKPFTKEGLLQMLEKHLSHLKKGHPGLDSTGMAPPPGQINKRSLKSEDSPVTSPATGSNWNSPGNLTGVSPANSNANEDPYMQAVHNSAGAAAVAAGYPIPPGMGPQAMYNTSPMSAPHHRRGISDISGGPGDMGGDMKRQQLFPPQLAAPQPPMHQRPR